MGDLPQKKRLKIIDEIKAGKLHLLVATDVAARGLDIADLAMVVNYDLPNETENYVHRIGRTARAGKTGKAVTLASEQDVYALPGIERYIGRKIPSETATEELFAEDKSEGRHIHTEFFQERGGNKIDEHSRRRNADGKKHDSGRHSRKDHHSPVEQRRGEKKSRGAEHGRTFQNHQDDSPQKGVKLSELSLEDRMAYYRQKYDKSVTAEGGQKKPDAKKPKSASQRKNKKHKQAKPVPGTEKPGVTPAAAKEKKVSKKGILSRLFDALKKKKS
jgi:ATP-dependent RNA helicase RhlB